MRSTNEIRTAAMLAATSYPEALAGLLCLLWHLRLDVADHGDVMAGWPEGTKAPPIGGWRLDVRMIEQ